MQEEFADQRLVVADRGQSQARFREGGIQVDPEAVGLDRFKVLRVHVGRRAGQLQVFDKALPVMDAAGPVVLQAGVQHVGLEGIERRRQSLHIASHAVQPGFPFGRIGLGVGVGPGGPLGDPGQHKGRLLGQFRNRLFERIELRGQQRPMDGQRTEAPAFRCLQFGDDPRDQSRGVRPSDPSQNGGGREPMDRGRIRQQPFHLGIGQRAQRIVGRDAGEESFPRDHGRRQCRGQVGLLVGQLLDMVELQSQSIAQVSEGPLRIRAVGQQRLPVFEQLSPLRSREALGPLGHRLGEFLRLSRGLVVQRVEKVMVLGTRHELPEGRLAVGGQGEGFDEADLGVRPDGRWTGQSSGQNPGGESEAVEGRGVHGGYRADVTGKPGEAPHPTTHGINKA